jgi:hypothetical protein
MKLSINFVVHTLSESSGIIRIYNGSYGEEVSAAIREVLTEYKPPKTLSPDWIALGIVELVAFTSAGKKKSS